MDWITNLFFGTGVAHSVFLVSLAIFIGIALGKIKIAGISLGVTWILFVGITLSHFNMVLDPHTLHFVKEFGLILFVYSIGLQVGPGFFESLKKGGLTLNLLASGVVLLGVVVTYALHLITDTPITTMVGVMSGAVTNTPGLGAAGQTYLDMNAASGQIPSDYATIAQGYALAYPLGVIGIIITIIAIKGLLGIKLQKEREVCMATGEAVSAPERISLIVENPSVFGKTIKSIAAQTERQFVVTRILRVGETIEAATPESILKQGDKLLVISPKGNEETLILLFGQKIDMDFELWSHLDEELIARRVVLTKSHLNGKSLIELNLRKKYGANVTRVNRAGVELMAYGSLRVQVGDRLTLVGCEDALNNASNELGNSVRRLREPNLIPIFVGICLGVLLGSIPILFPGIPQPVKLGLAGGPLVVSILISKFGPKYKLVTYTTMSANLMLREIGISLFLAAVGLGAGQGFIDTIVGGGYMWIIYGAIITVVPLLIIGFIGRVFCKLNYFTLSGLMAGSMTDPPALAYSNSVAGNDMPAIGYATVYPLTMFLRILVAQLMILFLV